MTFLSEFSYPEISQRRIVLLNAFTSFVILGIIYFYSSLTLKYYFIYQPVMQLVFLAGLCGIFFGNLIAKFILTKINSYRQIFVSADILFILACLFYIYGRLIISDNYDPLLYLYIKSQIYAALPIFAISLFAGIKINYFLKISCGNFIDNKRAVLPFLLFLLSGTALGIILSFTIYCFNDLFFFTGILLLPILPTIFLINLSYNPKPIYAQESNESDHTSGQQQNNHKRDDLFFIYLNFTYILIYFFLGFTTIIKYFGNFIYIKIFFILISVVSATVGIIFARIIKQAFWYIYAEMLYPVFFIISMVLLISFKDTISFAAAVCIFIPVSVILGFSIFQTINHVLLFNNHKNRFNIINFSLLVLPLPILISLNFIDFTYFSYFVLLYIVALMNIFIPGIYLAQSAVRGYKKLLFFSCALIFIPFLILMHMYFGIPLNSNFYITHTIGFESLNYINYNSRYIENESSVIIDKIKSFQADDSSVKNMKRSIAPVLLYANSSDWSESLFIDGNIKFFRNPVISQLKNANCLDYVSDRMTDFKTLPVSGDHNYVLDHSEILSYLDKKKSPYKIIVDIPNLFDQTINSFRFSKEFFGFIKNKLRPEGIFVQILAANCRKDFIAGTAESLKKTFKKTIIYYFPNYFVFLSSNKPDSLKINVNNINNFKEAFDSKNNLKNIFFNEYHMLSHILFLEINDFIIYTNNEKIAQLCFLRRPDDFLMDKNLIAGFTDNNSYFLDLIDKSGPNNNFFYNTQNQFLANKYLLSEVKKAELYEANKEYESESSQLINLRRQSEYKSDLRKYIWDILSYKENYYYNAALRFEKEKKWEEARKLYKAILLINKNHFEANYHLGILSIILQDLDASFEHLQYAMVLKKDDPKVLYQMGILLYSSGKPRDALVYFDKALAFKEKTASLFYYTGLCYEELDNLINAANCYNQAIALDPNDKNIISGIERIKEKTRIKRDESSLIEKKSDVEVEKGEDMPLPVEESARNIRIEEDKPESDKIGKIEKK
jgi:tetratricopeptide (TPR) repeat protein